MRCAVGNKLWSRVAGFLAAMSFIATGCGGSVEDGPPGDANASDAARGQEALTPPQDAVRRMAASAFGFFQRYRTSPGGQEMMFIALMPQGEEVCTSLSDLDRAASFRLEAEFPARIGPHLLSKDAEEASVRIVGPGYEDGVVVAPSVVGANEISVEQVRGSIYVDVADDPLEIVVCTQEHAPGGEVTQHCDCSSHGGVTSTCPDEGCCYAASESSFRIGMPFKAAPCSSLCDGLKKLGYECLP